VIAELSAGPRKKNCPQMEAGESQDDSSQGQVSPFGPARRFKPALYFSVSTGEQSKPRDAARSTSARHG